MRHPTATTVIALVMTIMLAPGLCRGANSALIIEAFTPEELYLSNPNNLGSPAWNDPYLAYELVCDDTCSNIMKFGRVPKNGCTSCTPTACLGMTQGCVTDRNVFSFSAQWSETRPASVQFGSICMH